MKLTEKEEIELYEEINSEIEFRRKLVKLLINQLRKGLTLDRAPSILIEQANEIVKTQLVGLDKEMSK